jgi:hypothetical protein
MPAADLKVGMKIKATLITGAGQPYSRWAPITAIGDNSIEKTSGTYVYGPPSDKPEIVQPKEIIYIGLNIRTDYCTFGATDSKQMFRVAATADTKAIAKQQALAFQATLTKTGKVRSNRKAQAGVVDSVEAEMVFNH